jgi:hypothetical protein
VKTTKLADYPYAASIHSDGTVTVWDVYRQQSLEHVRYVRDEVLASLPHDEREAVIAHLAEHADDDDSDDSDDE